MDLQEGMDTRPTGVGGGCSLPKAPPQPKWFRAPRRKCTLTACFSAFSSWFYCCVAHWLGLTFRQLLCAFDMYYGKDGTCLLLAQTVFYPAQCG